MKNLIGLFVVGFAIAAVLFSTCSGPSSDAPTENATANAPAAVADVPSVRAPAPEPASAPEPVPTTAVEAPSTPNASSPALPAATRPQFVPPVVSTTLAPLPLDVLPDAGIEAILAVHPRDLEAGSGRSSRLLLVSTDSLRSQLRIPLPDRNWLPTDFTRGQPSSTINTPTAYGQQWGEVFGGVGYQERIRYSDWTDGVASFGLGLGNPDRFVGLDVTVNILDTYTEFADDRSLSLKLHRRLPYRTAVAVGHENIWHTDGTDGGSSRYLVVSKVVLLRDRPTSSLGSMILNLGIGNDRFLPEAQFAREEDGMNVFGSLAVRVLPPVNAVANWTGQDLSLGLSIAPVRTWPLVITPAVVDLTGNAGDGARFTVSAGLSYNFRR